MRKTHQHVILKHIFPTNIQDQRSLSVAADVTYSINERFSWKTFIYPEFKTNTDNQCVTKQYYRYYIIVDKYCV